MRTIACAALLAACSTVDIASKSTDAASEGDAPLGPKNPPPTVTPPVVSCADAELACTRPASVCADDNWLAYFDGGECVNGTCRLTTKYYWCVTGCIRGACNVNRSTPPTGDRF